ncbi:MAG: hypothetical protein ACJAYU_004516 [Bradymonadia bacterium]|jgi:hypothetical protein
MLVACVSCNESRSGLPGAIGARTDGPADTAPERFDVTIPDATIPDATIDPVIVDVADAMLGDVQGEDVADEDSPHDPSLGIDAQVDPAIPPPDVVSRDLPEDAYIPPVPSFEERGGPCLALGVLDPAYDSWPAWAEEPGDVTIDTIVFQSRSRDRWFGGLPLVAAAHRYDLSDGSSFPSGAGGGTRTNMRVDRITRRSSTIRFHMEISADNFTIVRHLDAGDDTSSADYAFQTFGRLVLVAEEGSHVASLNTEVLVTRDQPDNPALSDFKRLSAPLCSVVPFSVTYTLEADEPGFSETTFDQEFGFRSVARFELVDYRPTAP